MMQIVPRWKITYKCERSLNFEIRMDTNYPALVLETISKLSYPIDVEKITIERINPNVLDPTITTISE